MKVADRRRAIVAFLISSKKAVNGSELAKEFNVSRQIIVQDISALKESGLEIISTHSGYIIQKTGLFERVFKLYHTREQTEDELMTIVDLGGTVVDVYVWHKVYGKVEAPLGIFSRLQVKQFIDGVRSGKSSELMNITGGYHYHTVSADSEAILDKIGRALEQKGYIAPEIN